MAKPSTDPYKVTFNWVKDDDQHGKLTAVSCEEENIPADKTWLGRRVNNYIQIAKQEVQKACLTVNKPNTLQLKKGGFLYMDVGCWLDGRQTFGLACGDDAMVCKYSPGQAGPAGGGGGKSSGNALLDEFTGLPGVSIISWKKIPAPHPAGPKRLYLILPDMHVAEAPPPGHPRPPDDPKWGTTDFGAWDIDPHTYDEWAKRDLFNSRASMPAMISFLSMVQGLGWANQITLVQLGDMYELWAARELLFKKSDDNQVHIIGEGVKTVGEWVGRTHLLYPELFHAFDMCASKEMQMVFLHGNHDDYLSNPDVAKAANAYIQTEPTRYGVDTRKGPATHVYPRQKELPQDNVFIEHGQRCDQYNRDGETEGYEKTNEAVTPGLVARVASWMVDLKNLDTVRRTTFVVGAAALWCVRERDFGLYVMGHTHTADLHQVEVHHKLEEIIYGPESVTIIEEGPLDGVSR